MPDTKDSLRANYRIETQCVQEGYLPKNGEPRMMPVYMSTAFKYDSTEYVGDLFDLKASGHFYTRLSNPSLEYVENRIAALEGGVGAILTSSGQAATLLAVMNLCKSGDHVVSAASIYGGTFNLFSTTLRKFGIEVTYVNQDADEDEIARAFRPNTKILFAETIANPALCVLDFAKMSAVARKKGVPLMVDNTFATPILCRPFELGADIVIHSATKYFDGHACTTAGVIVDSGNFDYTNGNFPDFTEPDPSYHGIVYTKEFGKAAFTVKARAQLMRDLGPVLSPHSAFLLYIGLDTLHLRMERHSQNALAAARFLKNHPQVEWVKYPGLPGDKYYDLAQKYLPKGASGVISFGIKGGRARAAKFIEDLKMTALIVHMADSRTAVLHPASTSHRQLTDEQLVACGVFPEMIRLSIGIEHIDDITADFEQAFN